MLIRLSRRLMYSKESGRYNLDVSAVNKIKILAQNNRVIIDKKKYFMWVILLLKEIY